MEGCEYSMVIMRIALADDMEKIQEFLMKHHLLTFFEAYSEKEFMLSEERGQILGISVLRKLSDNFAVVEGIYIIPSERGLGLGDGLLRSTLNYINLQGLDKAILLSDKIIEDFYIHEGLKPLSQLDEYPSTTPEGHFSREVMINSFYCDLNEFFSRRCKGSKGV